MGVRVGPMEPDAGEQFGAVNGTITARQLIRHHARMYDPRLLRLLTRAINEERSKTLLRDEVLPVILEDLPEGAVVHGVALRGQDDAEQAITYTFSVPRGEGKDGKGSGRVTKGALLYDPELFPASHKAGNEAVALKDAREAGIPTMPPDLYRLLAQALGQKGEPVESDEALVAERDKLRAERDALQAKLADAEQARAQAADETGGGETAEEEPGEPYEGYDAANADEVKAYLADHPEAAQAVLDYEKANKDRSTVTGAADQILDHTGASDA